MYALIMAATYIFPQSYVLIVTIKLQINPIISIY